MMEIRPLQSVGGISFGQTPDEVIRAWGAPTDTYLEKNSNLLRLKFDARRHCNFSAQRQLVSVTIGGAAGGELKLLGNDVFSIDVPRFLKEAGIPTTRDVDGFLVLTVRAHTLGIDFCYEQEGTTGEMAVHVYAEPQEPFEEWVPGSPKRYLA